MKKLTTLFFIVFFTQIKAASWSTVEHTESIYLELTKTHSLQTFFMKKKKSSEYFINSLKQLTYRTFWNKKVKQGSVDIEELPLNELEFIIEREFTEISMEDLKKINLFNQLSFYLGSHEEELQSCIDLILFDWSTKEAAIYSECMEL